MSLINCPECGNECAADATACPKCGHPFIRPAVVQPKTRVVVREVEREDSFPKWIFIPLGILGVIILFVVFAMLRKDDGDQRNVNVNIAGARTPLTTTPLTTTVVQSTPNQIVVPPTTSQPTTVTTLPPTTTTTTTLPPTTTTVVTAPPDKGEVSVEAKIMNRSGSAVPVAKEKFYLLDKDLESILTDAHLQDETGQGLTNAFGMSVVNPSRYDDFNRKALAAIKPHIVYSTLTDAAGNAALKDVKPNSYYLFGVHKTGTGFAIWSSPVSVNAGQNSLIIPPVTPTEVTDEP